MTPIPEPPCAASAGPIAWLREARWLSSERMRGYAVVFALATLGTLILRFAVRYDSDYLTFWTAGRAALGGEPAAAYNVAAHWAMERAQSPHAGFYSFFYPPVWLLLCAPLAVLPFASSMLVFVIGQLAAYLLVIRKWLPGATIAMLGCTGTTMAIGTAQNGLLTTVLFGGALLALPRRGVASGILFGCLCYKPQFGLAIPLALLAARQWRAFLAATATVLALVAASLLAFGVGTWRAFLAIAPLAERTLRAGLASNITWESLYRAVVQAGGGATLAAVSQGLLTVAALVAVVVVGRRRPAALAGVLPMAALVANPHLFVYDLALLALPIGWVVAEARRGRFLPWEKSVLGLAYVAPLLSVFLARFGVPLGPVALLALFAVVLRRAVRAAPA